MNKENLVKQAIIAVIYTVLTLILPALSYGALQFRFSEVLTLLAYYNPSYIVGLTLGCAISNIFSPFGVIDIFVGSFASFIALYSMSKIKNIYLASTMPAVFSVLVGLEIAIISNDIASALVITGQIMLSELVIVSICGVILFKLLEKNKQFKEIVLGNSND